MRWGYSTSFLFGFILLSIGFLLELLAFDFIRIPPFPGNIYIGLILINLLVIAFLAFRTHSLVVWLMSVPASLSAITFYTLLVLSMGFIPQEPSEKSWITALGLNQVIQSWPFLLLQMFFLVTLGMVTLKRTIPFRLKNWGFILNHLGLWIVIIAAALGTGDFKRLNLVVFEKESNALAVNRQGDHYQLPFAVHLNDFDIQTYPPKLAIADRSSGKLLASALIADPDAAAFNLNNWQIQLNHNNELSTSNSAYAFDFSAKNQAITNQGTLRLTGSEADFARLADDQYLVLLPPEPRKFISEVKIFDQQKEKDLQILVNQPADFAGWKIYQSSYDESAGKDSAYSIFEVIKDPWLPVVYAGLIMLIVGAVYLFWTGNNLKKKKNDLG